jgi:hypothetical protein
MTSPLAVQVELERADWKKIVFALADYAYRALGPDTTWDEARVMVRATISLALDPKLEDWDPRDETLLMHLGQIMHDAVIVARDQRGTGRAAREEAPDWALAARTFSTAEIHKQMKGAAGLPISVEEYFRTRRRTRRHAIDVLNELRAGKR